MNRSFYARYAWPIIIVLAGFSFPAFWGQKQAYKHSNNNIHQWLPQHFEETDTYEQFRSVFGTDNFALVSWDGCTLQNDDKLEEFARRVNPPPADRKPGDGSEWFRKVVTGPQMLRQLMDEPLNLLREEALDRLEGVLVGPDRESTCAVITFSEAGDADRTKALAALRRIAEEDCSIQPEKLRFGGDAVLGAAIDIESRRAIRQWIALSWVVALAVAWCCLRSVKVIAMVFVVAGYSSALATALIYYTGGTMNLVLVMVPALIYVLPLSAAVHLINYYRDAIRESGPAGAPQRAMAAGWTPCALSAITTALGLSSLFVSPILPVRLFGVYSALGILLSLVILFLLLPATMETWPLARASEASRSSAVSHNRLLRRLAGWIVRHHRPVAAISLAMLAFFAGGVARMQTTVTSTRFFSPTSKWVRDNAWLQDRIGPLVPIEVVIRFDKQCPMSFLDRMQLVRQVESTLRSFGPIGGTISAATFGPSWAASQTPLSRRVANVRLQRARDRLAKTGYLHIDAEGELWRISARVGAFTGVDHDRFLRRVEDRIDALLRQQASSPATVRAAYTGAVPLVYLAQRELLNGLFRSFCLAFVMIAVVMALLLRSVTAGLLVMLPNVFPAVATFGTMGWTGTLIDIGAMMTASVALGIAVDDTLHFLTWFRRALKQGQSRPEAIVEAYQRCAPAMAQTTLIAGLGLLVFHLSSFQPVSQFGLLMFILLLAALVGDLVLLPAILASRFGSLVELSRPQCRVAERVT